eukprot:Gb_35469 [translate_table: standard]
MEQVSEGESERGLAFRFTVGIARREDRRPWQGRYHDNSYDDQYNYSAPCPPKPQYAPRYGHGCNPAPYDQEEIEVEKYEDNYGHRPMKPVYNGHEGREGYYRLQAPYAAEAYEAPAPSRRRPPPTCNSESIYWRQDRYNGRY